MHAQANLVDLLVAPRQLVALPREQREQPLCMRIAIAREQLQAVEQPSHGVVIPDTAARELQTVGEVVDKVYELLIEKAKSDAGGEAAAS